MQLWLLPSANYDMTMEKSSFSISVNAVDSKMLWLKISKHFNTQSP